MVFYLTFDGKKKEKKKKRKNFSHKYGIVKENSN